MTIAYSMRLTIFSYKVYDVIIDDVMLITGGSTRESLLDGACTTNNSCVNTSHEYHVVCVCMCTCVCLHVCMCVCI